MRSLDSIPSVRIPTERGSYKVAQLKIDDRNFLWFGDYDSYHADIMSKLLLDCRIEYRTIRKLNKEIPSPKGERYELIGAGFASVYPAVKEIGFMGESFHYEMGISEQQIRELGKEFEGWNIFLGESKVL